MRNSLRVGICGFGVAGGALAVMLARRGYVVTLLERAPEVGPVGAGFLLQPSGQRVLDELDLLESVVASSARITRLEAFTETGWQLTDLRYGHRGTCAYGVHRGVLFDVLHEAARQAGVSITLNAEAAGVDETENGPVMTDASGRLHGPFDVLVGADGSRSLIRRWLNPRERQAAYEHGALWGSGSSEHPVDSLYQVTRSARRLLGLLPTGGGRCAFFWGMRSDEWATVKARGFAAFREEVVDMCPKAAGIIDEFGGFDRLTFAGYTHALPRRVHSRRVVLAGDAAHSMSPHLGQGANLALLDAECLARHLAEHPVELALSKYAAERRPQSRYFSFLSRWLSPFFQSDHEILGWSRDVALPLMCAVPWVRHQMELSVSGLKRGFFDQVV